jgi:hypothetical protein
MGDLNVNGESMPGRECFPGESAEYPNLLSIFRLHDAFRNAPCFDEKFKITVDVNNQLVQIFEDPQDRCDQRLDYLFYSHGNFFDLLPLRAEVKQFKVSPPITEDGASSEDLSDHYGLAVEFSLYR